MAKDREKRAARKKFSGQASVDNQPGSSKCRYLHLPPQLKLWQPEEGEYDLIFLPWTAGKNSRPYPQGELTWTRYLAVHKFIGMPGSEADYLCSASIGKRCAVCEQCQYLRRTGARDKEYFNGVIKPLLPKDREIMLIHVLNDKKNPQNLFVWDESVHLFGNAFRTQFRKREKWLSFADLEEGCIVGVTGTKKQISENSCVTFEQGIVIEPRSKPLPDFLIEASEKFCLDDYVVETPYVDLKRLMDASGAVEEEAAEPEQEEPKARMSSRRERIQEEEQEEPEVDEEETTEEEEEEPEEKPTRRNSTASRNGTRKPAKQEEEEEEIESDDEEEEIEEEDLDDEEEPEVDEDESEEEEEEPEEKPVRRQRRK